MKPDLTLLTPTGDRQEAFALCEQWIARMGFGLWLVEWIVVDDGEEPTEAPRFDGRVVYLRRPRQPDDGAHTLAAQVAFALPHVSADRLLIIEDDDWYGTQYAWHMMTRLERATLTGERSATYYHLPTGGWRILDNPTHASLAQTGLRRDLYPALADIASRGSPYIDLALWSECAGELHESSGQHISLKGMPGREGIGAGHNETLYSQHDADGGVLRHLLGADAEAYRAYRHA